MGVCESKDNFGNTGIIDVLIQGGRTSGNLIGISTGGISINLHSTPSSGKSTVANATGRKLRIFYLKKEMKLEDILTTEATTKRVFKPEAGIPFIDLPPKEFLECPNLVEGFASIFVADGDVCVETISLNFPVPHGACTIVSASNQIKFRKSDGGVWIDEDGQNHCTW